MMHGFGTRHEVLVQVGIDAADAGDLVSAEEAEAEAPVAAARRLR